MYRYTVCLKSTNRYFCNFDCFSGVVIDTELEMVRKRIEKGTEVRKRLEKGTKIRVYIKIRCKLGLSVKSTHDEI